MPYNHVKALNRQEFLCLLVKAAVLRHVSAPSARHSDVGSALDELIAVDILPAIAKADPAALAPANDFRQKWCYTEATSEVLRRHAPSLRAMFAHYSIGDGRVGDALNSASLMSMEEWRTLLSHLALVDSQFGEREATQCFVRSRMRAVRESETRGRARLLQLYFEDFMEAVVRVALVKAVPTDKEVAEAGCADGGDFLLRLYAEGGGRLAAFLDSHDQPSPARLQPAHRCVDHLLCLVVRIIIAEAGCAGAKEKLERADLMLTAQEVKAFFRKRQPGGRA